LAPHGDLLLLTVAVGGVGGGWSFVLFSMAVVVAADISSLLLSISSLYNRCHLIAFTLWRCHSCMTVCIGGSWPR